ncbi:hypothetical protein L0128_19380 [candidate division KSB1 bacterium]|nr:hypothetical protein [candidate division KSB1 bacterium]
MREIPLISKSNLPESSLQLQSPVRPGRFCGVVGPHSAFLGDESGRFEAWIFPWKILHHLSLNFILEKQKLFLSGPDWAKTIQVQPTGTTITYQHTTFYLRQSLFAPVDFPGLIMLLEATPYFPLKINVAFQPDLVPQWPAGMGGQYTLWQPDLHAYLIAEGARQCAALIGSPLAAPASFTPGHQLPTSPLEFTLDLSQVTDEKKLIPIVMVASETGRELCFERYHTLLDKIPEALAKIESYYTQIGASVSKATTPNAALNQTLVWSRLAIQKGIHVSPTLGSGLVAGFGIAGPSQRPGFAWFFGGDTCYNSLALNCLGDFETSRRGLDFLRRQQRKDGKVPHEITLSASLIDWFTAYPYAFYHADTTPYYILAMYDYYKWSGDLEFITQSWESLQQAFRYCLSADQEQDGLMKNRHAGLAAMEVGALSARMDVDLYLAATWLKALEGMLAFAEIFKDQALEATCRTQLALGRTTVLKIFYDASQANLNFARLEDGNIVKDLTVWQTVPLAFEVLPPKLELTGLFQRLSHSDMFTDWGFRILSRRSEYYDPTGYNTGAVWPFLSGYAVWGEYRAGRPVSAFEHLMALVRSADADALGVHTELLSGEFFVPVPTSVPHQIFSSAGVILALERGLLGLEANVPQKQLTFAPQLPYHWRDLDLSGLRFGDARLDLQIQQGPEKFHFLIKSDKKQPFTLKFTPGFAPGTKLNTAKWDQKPIQWTEHLTAQSIQFQFELQIQGLHHLELGLFPGVELILFHHETAENYLDNRLKLIDYESDANHIRFKVQGRPGYTYRILLRNLPAVDSNSTFDLLWEGQNAMAFLDWIIGLDFRDQTGVEFVEREIELKYRI